MRRSLTPCAYTARPSRRTLKNSGGASRIRFSLRMWTTLSTTTASSHVERGLWRLAPAFDINPFPDRARELKTSVSAKTGPEATIDALMSVIAYFRITVRRAKEIRREVEPAVAGWRKSGRALGLTNRHLEDYADAFEHAERKAVRKIVG